MLTESERESGMVLSPVSLLNTVIMYICTFFNSALPPLALLLWMWVSSSSPPQIRLFLVIFLFFWSCCVFCALFYWPLLHPYPSWFVLFLMVLLVKSATDFLFSLYLSVESKRKGKILQYLFTFGFWLGQVWQVRIAVCMYGGIYLCIWCVHNITILLINNWLKSWNSVDGIEQIKANKQTWRMIKYRIKIHEHHGNGRKKMNG